MSLIADVQPQPRNIPTPTELGKVIRSCRVGRATQNQVIERVAALGFTLGQTTLSSYERGETVPTIVMAAAIELACERPLGWIAAQAGLLAELLTVGDAVAMDPMLSDESRGEVLATYEACVGFDSGLDGHKPGDDGALAP